jgi:hypothetical protein
MDRRKFLQGSLGAALLGPLLAKASRAQEPAMTYESLETWEWAPVTRRLVLDAHSRNLQWLRSADEVAKATIEMVCGGVCVTVGQHPAHVDPASVAQDLPAFANRIRSHGLTVTQVAGPAIQELSAPQAEAMIAAVADAGCTHYSLGTYTYDLASPLGPQLDSVKAKLEPFVRLNERLGVKLLYDTVAGAESVGGVVLDLLPVFREFDPRYVGFRWDTGHMALHGDGMWETLIRSAGPYVAGVGWRDRGWEQDLGLLGEGGPYAGPYPRVEPLITLPDGSAVPRPAVAAGRGGGGRGGGGAAQGPANSAGAGSQDADNPLFRSMDGEMPKRPIGGKNAKGGGWSAPNVPMGMGVVHIPRVATVLSEMGFDGPTVLQSEYPGIGGAESGADQVTRERQFVIGMLKRDGITIRKSFEMANTGVAI